MGRRQYLRALADLLHLPGLHPRRLVPTLCRLAGVAHDRHYLTLAALNHAIALRRPQPGLVHHSDRGVQYASSAYIERLAEIGAQISMSAKGNPYDNAKAESFFKTLKREEVYLNQYESFTDAEAQLGRFIDDVYNQKRLHSSLGYLPPVEYESLYNPTEKHP
jgi:putative transposase